VVAGGTAQRASQARKSPFDFIVYIVGTAGIQISSVIMRFCGEPESVCAVVERQRIERRRDVRVQSPESAARELLKTCVCIKLCSLLTAAALMENQTTIKESIVRICES
jgi:hypothetical protein